MKRVERLGETRTPDGITLALVRHDGAYSIKVDGVELMSTRRVHSEEALADVVCRPVQEKGAAQVLIGGLGFGFTLRAALRLLPAGARVVVAELVAGVIEWNRNPAYPLAGAALLDGRVELCQEDVTAVLQRSRGRFDAIMLDVDNGAAALTTAKNARLYESSGVALAIAALKPAGRVAWWSAQRDRAFEKRLRATGLAMEVVQVRGHATSGGWHSIFVIHNR